MKQSRSLQILRWFCPSHLLEEIEGDLLQKFKRDAKTFGERKAKRRLLWNIIRFCRLGIVLRSRQSKLANPIEMLQNHFKIAFRYLLKRKTFSVINVIGLAVGLTAFFLIVQYISFELSYDTFHRNSDNIYRLALERHKNGVFEASSASNFAGLRNLLRDNFPEAEAVTGFYKTPANTGVFFRYKGKIYNELGGELNADSSFFRVFESLLLKGDAATALIDPRSMVVSEAMARKLFGDTEPLGQHVEKPNEDQQKSDCIITGVMRDLPTNSHFHANFVVPLDYQWSRHTEWTQDYLLTYIALRNGTDAKQFGDRLNSVCQKMERNNPEIRNTKTFLQPLTSIHLSSQLEGELEANGSWNLVYVVCAIGMIILALAWINYVNVETARFTGRAQEVSVKRVIGSTKSDLALQFLVEYFCLLITSTFLAALLTYYVLPNFSYLTSIPIEKFQWSEPVVWLTALAVLIGGSFLVGVYPALFILRLNITAGLKGKFGTFGGGRTVRRSLIVVQFTSSLILIACVLVMNGQLDFMRITNKKFNVDNVVILRNPTAYSGEEVIDKHIAYGALNNKLMETASVQMLTSSSAVPGTEIGFTYVNLLKRNVNDPYDPTPFKTLFVDDKYIPFYGLKLLAGTNFAAPRPVANWINPWDDMNWLTLILNESAIHALGFNSADEAVDQIVEFENFEDHFQKHRIIGVIEDYHHEAVKKAVLPMILSPNYGSFQQVYYSIRLHPQSNPEDAVNEIGRSWKTVFPDKPFEYSFLDRYYDQQFKTELYAKRIFSVFAGIAIFISCLGILGLTLFETNARVKEITIRKILGASATSLVALLSRDNLRLLLVAGLISAPIIYYVADEWLSKYPIRINISLLIFIIPAIMILIVVAFTSSFQTIKAANANPVDHLKHE